MVAQVLPASMPQLSEADAAATQYSLLVRALQLQRQLAREWFEQLPAEATGGASREAFDWALAVSRSSTHSNYLELFFNTVMLKIYHFQQLGFETTMMTNML